VRYPRDFRTLDMLEAIRISTDAGPVPIANFVTRCARSRRQLRQPHRQSAGDDDQGRRRRGRARRRRGQGDPGVAQGRRGFDPRVSIAFKGEDEEQKQAQAFLVKAFGVAIFLMAIILVTQFNSFYSAGLILAAVVMSTIGVFIGLLVTGQPFGIVMGGIGVIALAGIVVNNNIVLIDTYDRLRNRRATPATRSCAPARSACGR
jgi:multidrug efflux pump